MPICPVDAEILNWIRGNLDPLVPLKEMSQDQHGSAGSLLWGQLIHVTNLRHFNKENKYQLHCGTRENILLITEVSRLYRLGTRIFQPRPEWWTNQH